eukprot:7271942-Prymnesium_polylepis.1
MHQRPYDAGRKRDDALPSAGLRHEADERAHHAPFESFPVYHCAIVEPCAGLDGQKLMISSRVNGSFRCGIRDSG